MDEKIGARVRELRRQASMNVTDAAMICGLSHNQYLDSESGKRRFSSHELFKLCDRLDTTLTDILGVLRKP